MTSLRVAIFTVSDGVSAGEREDLGGPACAEALASSGVAHEIVLRETYPDDPEQIATGIRRAADLEEADVILLTGGTGVSPRDRTPEAVREATNFEIPGLAEKMRSETGRDFPTAYLSRQVAAVRHRTLVIALPGSPRGAADCLLAVASLLPHAVSLLQGGAPPHPRPAGVAG